MPSCIAKLNDGKWLQQQYVVEKKSDRAIADMLDCNQATVGGWRNKHGIPARKQAGEDGAHWRGGPVICKCAQCGKPIKRDTHSATVYKHHFCSNGKCQVAWISEHRVGKDHPSWKGGLVKCKCAQCGAELRKRPCDMAMYKRQFCNKKCLGAWISEHRTGENSPGWKGGATTERGKWEQAGGREWKRACRKRDDYACQRCGKTFVARSRSLQVHHKAAFADYPELRSEKANGVCLCRTCHEYIHSNEGLLIRLRWEQEGIG